MSECSLCGCTQAGKHEEIERLDAEIAAMTERFVPLVEENERLRAALLRLCRACDPAYDGWGAEEIEVLNEARAALAQPAATGEGHAYPCRYRPERGLPCTCPQPAATGEGEGP